MIAGGVGRQFTGLPGILEQFLPQSWRRNRGDLDGHLCPVQQTCRFIQYHLTRFHMTTIRHSFTCAEIYHAPPVTASLTPMMMFHFFALRATTRPATRGGVPTNTARRSQFQGSGVGPDDNGKCLEPITAVLKFAIETVKSLSVTCAGLTPTPRRTEGVAQAFHVRSTCLTPPVVGVNKFQNPSTLTSQGRADSP